MSFRLGHYLVQKKSLTVEQVDRAMRRQHLLGGSLDTNLLELQFLSLDELESALPPALGVPAPEASWLSQPSVEAITCLSPTLLQQLQLVPVALQEGVVHLLGADVGPPPQIATIEYWLGSPLVVHPIPQIRLFQAMFKLYGITIPQRLSGLHQRFPLQDLFALPAEWQRGQHPLSQVETQVYAVASSAAVSGLVTIDKPEQSASVMIVSGSSKQKLTPPSPSKRGFMDDAEVTSPDMSDALDSSASLSETSPRDSSTLKEQLIVPPAIVVKKKGDAKVARSSASHSTFVPGSEHDGKEQSLLSSQSMNDELFRHVEPGTRDISNPAELPEELTVTDELDPRSILNLPAASSLRNAFRKNQVPLQHEKTRVQERSSITKSPVIEPITTTKVPPVSLRDTITERKSNLIEVREQTNSELIVALTEEDVAGSEIEPDSTEEQKTPSVVPDIHPFETSHDLSLAVNIIQQAQQAKAAEDTEPKAIFELSELFSPEGQATMPGLPAFPPTTPFNESDIFPEVTQMDTSRQTIGPDRESSDAVALKDVAVDEVNQTHKLDLDEYLVCQDDARRSELRVGMLKYGASLIPSLLSYLPESEQGGDNNPALKQRFERLVEICEMIGDPALFRMLQLLEKSSDTQRKQILMLLGYWRPPRAIAPLLQRMYTETKPSILRMICNNLQRYRGQEGFSKLLQFLRENLSSNHPHRLQKALFYLGHLRITEAVSDVISLLEHPQANIQEVALETLRLLTLQNYNGEPKAWRSWWALHGKKSRKQWVVDAMNHPQIVVRQRVKEELLLEFGDDFGYQPDSLPDERDTVRKLATLWIKQS